MDGRDSELDFEGVKFCGRNREMIELHCNLQNACDVVAPTREVVMVEGESGIGKSALVQAFRKSLVERKDSKVVFCSGKFDQEGRSSESDQFSIIVDCMTDLVNGVDSECFEAWWSEMQEEMGPDLRALQKSSSPHSLAAGDNKDEEEGEEERDNRNPLGFFLSLLRTHLRAFERVEVGKNNVTPAVKHDGHEEIPSTTTSGLAHAGNWGFERLRWAVRSLVRIVCSQQPVVFFLDDLQWADKNSISIVRTLATDRYTKRFLLIGAHRVVSDDHPVYLLKHQLPSSKVQVTNISLGALSTGNVSEFLSNLLRRDLDAVEPLATIVHRKTGGNPFWLLHFLRLLHRKGLLVYKFPELCWEWNVGQILSKTEIANQGLVEVLRDKLKTIPSALQLALASAAFLGLHRFNAEILFQTMIGMALGDSDRVIELQDSDAAAGVSRLEATLDLGVREGIVERISTAGRYKFCHDNIKEYADSLLPVETKRERLHLNVGRQLRRFLSKPSQARSSFRTRERVFLVAVRHLNQGSDLIVHQQEKVDLVRLNQEAAEIAVVKSSFFAAAEYLETSLSLLDSSRRWDKHYRLTLKVTSMLAHVCFCSGSDKSSALTDEVLSNARSLKDKLPVYRTLILALARKGESAKAIEMALYVLRELGVPMPRMFRRMHIRYGHLRVKRMLRGFSDEQLLDLPPIARENFEEASEFMFLLCQISAETAHPDYYCMGLIRSVRMTLRHGAGHDVSLVIARCAALQIMLGEYDLGKRYSKLALQLAAKRRYPLQDAWAVIITHLLVAHWSQPYHASLEPVLKAHRTLVEVGEIALFYVSVVAYSLLYYHCGLNLLPLSEDMLNFVEMLDDYGQHHGLAIYRPQVQMVLNLLGRSDDPIVLTGEVMDQEKCMKTWTDRHALQNLYVCRMLLAYYFDDHELAYNMSLKLRGAFEEGTTPGLAPRYFFEGLINLSLARSTGQRKYRRKGTKLTRMQEGFLRGGNVNCHHMLLLLEAELQSLKGCEHDVQQAYDEAIAAAGKVGFMHNQALANERAGKYFLHKNDRLWASTYLLRSVELYFEWGAVAKAADLQKKFSWLLGSNANGVARRSSFFRARPRFDEMSFRDRSMTSLLTDTSREMDRWNRSTSLGSTSGTGEVGSRRFVRTSIGFLPPLEGSQEAGGSQDVVQQW